MAELANQASTDGGQKTIEQHREFLEDHIDPDSGLLEKLHDNRTLSRREYLKVKDKSLFFEKNSVLLDYILEKHQSDRLIAALLDTRQKHIVNYLNTNAVVVRVHATLDGEDVAETEQKISSAIANEIVTGRSSLEAHRILDLVTHKVIAAKFGKSIILYIYCKTFEEMQQLHDSLISGRLRDSIELWFNCFLAHSQKIAVAELAVSTEQLQKIRKYFKAKRIGSSHPSLSLAKTWNQTARVLLINILPPELLDIILKKSYLLFVLSGKQSPEKRDEFLLLSSVDFCWFQRLNKHQLKRTIWRLLSNCYRKFRKGAVIFRNNRSFLEENIQPEGLIRELKSADCLTDVEARLLSRQTLIQGREKIFRKNNNPHLLHLMRSLDDAKRSDFIHCLQKSNQKSIKRLAESGGAFLKATILNQDTSKIQLLDQRINELRYKTKPRSDQTEKVISQLKDDDIEILNSLQDRQIVVWFWCRSQKGLEKIQQLNESKRLIDVINSLTATTSSSSETNKTTVVSICRDQFKKSVVMLPIFINFVGEISMKDAYIIGVTKLRNEIYVLVQKHRADIYAEVYPRMIICVFEDRNPFRLQKEIRVKEIKHPEDIGSNKKENCLYVTDYKEKCIWKITRLHDRHTIIKWLTTDYIPNALSVSSDGKLLVVNWNSPVLRIYGSDAGLLRSIQLSSDIKNPIHAVETSTGNFIILHRYWKENEKESGSSWRETEGAKQNICEVTGDGETVIRRFIPSNRTQKIFEAYRLSLDSDDRVFVADFGKNRVILLDSDLKWIRTTEEVKQWVGYSRSFCYDEERKQLIAGIYYGAVNVFTLNRK